MNHDWWLLLGPVGGFFNYLKPPDLRGQPHPLRRFSPPKGRLKDIIQEQHGIAEDRQLLCYKGTLGGLDGAIFADLFQIRNCRTPSHGPNLAPFFLWNFRCNQPWSFQVRTRPKRFREGYLLFFPNFDSLQLKIPVVTARHIHVWGSKWARKNMSSKRHVQKGPEPDKHRFSVLKKRVFGYIIFILNIPRIHPCSIAVSFQLLHWENLSLQVVVTPFWNTPPTIKSWSLQASS